MSFPGEVQAQSALTPENALPGRSIPILSTSPLHAVLGTSILAQPQGDEEVIYLAFGCFWGAEKSMWELKPVTTSVGYMGGLTPHPTYQEVCTGRTGHAEAVRVVYNPALLSTEEILRVFLESHDPTNLNEENNDANGQYRSAIFATTPQQAEIAQRMIASYQKALDEQNLGKIVTKVHADAVVYYPAEEYHQQYIQKNPGRYRCHGTGVSCPLPEIPSAT